MIVFNSSIVLKESDDNLSNSLKIIDDPSGDSFIENPNAPKRDPRIIQSYYRRNMEQNEMLGIRMEVFEKL